VLAGGLVSSVVAVASFWAGRSSAPAHEAPADASRSDPPMARAVDRAINQPSRTPPPALAVCPRTSNEDPIALSEARRKRAEFLLNGVFNQLAGESQRGTDPAEARADAVLPYLSGVLNGALQADPGIRGAFAAQFTSALCERTLADDQAISVAHIALALPDVASDSGFECFFSKAKEGVPLWTMLDAWRRSGLPKTPAIARLQASATDSRTTRRFLSDEEALAQRMSNMRSTEAGH
jgi:hypothetical protein